MAIDPKDITLPSYLVDTNRFSSVLGSAVDLSHTNAFSALTTAMDATSALRTALYPSVNLLSSAITPLKHFESAAVSLASLTPTMNALSAAVTTAPFAGTISALATAGNIGMGMQHMLRASALAMPSFKLPELSFGAAAYQVGIADSLRLSNSFTSPYLGSSAAVFALDTSYSKLLAGQISSLATIEASVVPSYISSLQTDVWGLSSALRDSWASISTDVNRFSALTTLAIRGPAVELYTAAHAAASVSLPLEEQPDQDFEIEEIVDDAVDSFESRLAALNQSLVTTYRGGTEALERGGTDWQRHAMVSFRELTTHVLHVLAPDEKILAIAREEDLHEGRPTRKARLNYIFAEVSGPEIASFYEADVKAAIALFTLLNEGTHRLEQRATKGQVHYLRGRVVGLLAAMLQARGY